MFSSDAAQHFIQLFPPLFMLQLIDLNLNGAYLTPDCMKFVDLLQENINK